MTSINAHKTCTAQNGQWWRGVLFILQKISMWTILLFLFLLDYHWYRVNPYLKRMVLENKSLIHPRAKCTVARLVLLTFTLPTAKANPSWSLRGKHQTSNGGGWVLNNTESLPFQGVKVTLFYKSFDLFKRSHFTFQLETFLLNLTEIFPKKKVTVHHNGL